MPKRLSSTTEVLLGLLSVEPMSGYDLGLSIRQSVGHFWNESYGQIYPSLKKLEAGALVTSETERRQGRPDRHVYSITKKGRERLAAWLAIEPQSEIPRNELLLKLFFGAQVPAELLIAYVERMMERERAVVSMLAQRSDELSAAGQPPDAAYWHIAVRFGQLELEAHQQWAEETLKALRKLAKKQRRHGERKKEKHRASK